MRFGISPKSMGLILNSLNEMKDIEKASIFGSRGIGNYKNGSDVDIAIYGTFITAETVNKLSITLNEKLPLPYYFDIVHYNTLKHEGLKKHIDDLGIVFYERTII